MLASIVFDPSLSALASALTAVPWLLLVLVALALAPDRRARAPSPAQEAAEAERDAMLRRLAKGCGEPMPSRRGQGRRSPGQGRRSPQPARRPCSPALLAAALNPVRERALLQPLPSCAWGPAEVYLF